MIKKFDGLLNSLFGRSFNNYEELHDWLMSNKAEDKKLQILMNIISDFVYFAAPTDSSYLDYLKGVTNSMDASLFEGDDAINWLKYIGLNVHRYYIDYDDGTLRIEVGVPRLEVKNECTNVPELINYLVDKFSYGDVTFISSFALKKFLGWLVTGEDIDTGYMFDGYTYSADEFKIDDEGYVSARLNDTDEATRNAEIEEKISKYIELGEGAFTTNVQWDGSAHLDYFRRVLKSMLDYVGTTYNCETIHQITTMVDCSTYDDIDDTDAEEVTTHTVREVYTPMFNWAADLVEA